MSDETTLRETLAKHVLDDAGCWCGLPEANPSKWAAHLETVVLAWVGARLAGADVLEDVCEAIADVSGCHDRGEANAAIWVLRDALGVPVAPAGGEVAPEATGDEIGRENGAEGFACPIDAPHGPHSIQTFVAGGEPGPVPLLRGRHCPGVTICDPGCPLLGCPTCPAEAANRAMLEAE